MNDEMIITHVFVCIDDIIRNLDLDTHPGPTGELGLSEIITLMALHPLLKPGRDLKYFHHWLQENWLHFFPKLVEYSRLTRLFKQYGDFLKRLSDVNSFGLVADGTALPVMHLRRGPWGKVFRNGRLIKCASKNEWYWGFLLQLVIDQAGHVAFFSVSTAAEIRQLVAILEDLKDRWVLGDKGYRGKEIHETLWEEKQIKIKLTNNKERTWIENVIGVLKNRLGLDRIRVRTMESLLVRVTAVLCAYNLSLVLNLPI
jgi:hypothetical protein